MHNAGTESANACPNSTVIHMYRVGLNVLQILTARLAKLVKIINALTHALELADKVPIAMFITIYRCAHVHMERLAIHSRIAE